MKQERVEGLSDVATLLRKMAECIESGTIPVGADRIPCRSDLIATVEVPDGEEGSVLVVSLRLTGERGRRPITLEEELSHPGG